MLSFGARYCSLRVSVISQQPRREADIPSHSLRLVHRVVSNSWLDLPRNLVEPIALSVLSFLWIIGAGRSSVSYVCSRSAPFFSRSKSGNLGRSILVLPIPGMPYPIGNDGLRVARMAVHFRLTATHLPCMVQGS